VNSQLSVALLKDQSDIPNGFDCGDEQPDLDLRDFLLREAWPFQRRESPRPSLFRISPELFAYYITS
jgi:hypothetical protein